MGTPISARNVSHNGETVKSICKIHMLVETETILNHIVPGEIFTRLLVKSILKSNSVQGLNPHFPWINMVRSTLFLLKSARVPLQHMPEKDGSNQMIFFAEQKVLNPFAMQKNSPKNIPKSVCIMLNPNPSCCK